MNTLTCVLKKGVCSPLNESFISVILSLHFNFAQASVLNADLLGLTKIAALTMTAPSVSVS